MSQVIPQNKTYSKEFISYEDILKILKNTCLHQQCNSSSCNQLPNNLPNCLRAFSLLKKMEAGADWRETFRDPLKVYSPENNQELYI